VKTETKAILDLALTDRKDLGILGDYLCELQDPKEIVEAFLVILDRVRTPEEALNERRRWLNYLIEELEDGKAMLLVQMRTVFDNTYLAKRELYHRLCEWEKEQKEEQKRKDIRSREEAKKARVPIRPLTNPSNGPGVEPEPFQPSDDPIVE
jgi:hypothetical protein